GIPAHAAGRRPQDRQRGAWHLVQESGRSCGGHARPSHLAPFGADPGRRPQENRAGPHEDYSSGKMDRLLAPDHPSRTGAVLRAQTQMCRMSAGKPLPRRRQDLVDSGDPQVGQTLRLKHSKTHTLESKGKLNENWRVDGTHFARLDLLCTRAERLLALHPYGAAASRNGRAISDRTDRFTLCVHRQRGSGRWRRAFAGEPLRAVGPRASWPRDREHLFLPSAHGTFRPATRDHRGYSVGHCGLPLPAVLLRDLCTAGDIVSRGSGCELFGEVVWTTTGPRESTRSQRHALAHSLA